MALQVKRRMSGASGDPAALKSGQVAYSGVDKRLVIGHGDDGAGNATSVEPIGGSGAAVMLTGAQMVAGTKTFSSSPIVPTPAGGDNSTKVATTAFVQTTIAGFGAGDMAKSVYDTNNNGKVDAAETADSVPWSGTASGRPATFPPSAHAHPTSDITGLDTALAAKAPVASPTFTGTPAAPTAAGGTSSTQIATTAFVQTAISGLLGGAPPAALDTLYEIAAQLQNDESAVASLTTTVSGKLAKASNLSDLSDVAAARGNLGLGSIATQAASGIAITGGALSGVTITTSNFDDGTF